MSALHIVSGPRFGTRLKLQRFGQAGSWSVSLFCGAFASVGAPFGTAADADSSRVSGWCLQRITVFLTWETVSAIFSSSLDIKL